VERETVVTVRYEVPPVQVDNYALKSLMLSTAQGFALNVVKAEVLPGSKAQPVSSRVEVLEVRDLEPRQNEYGFELTAKVSLYGVRQEIDGNTMGDGSWGDVEKSLILKSGYSSQGGFLFYTPLGNNYTITADKTDYISGRTTVSTSGKSVMDPDDTTTVTIYMRKITNDFEFHVQNVYYNFDKGDFQPDSYGSLDSLVKFMQDNPSVSVEIRSYTDGKGDDEYNNELSVKRAQAVMNYMATKGIDRGRMIARGEGKKNPIKPNTVNGEDNPTGRQYNRRTEFRIIGDIPEMRIIYDLNRPDYIDKSGEQRRQDQLRINNDVEDDGEPASGEIKTGSRVGGE
jgi:outer membrane protein OmpA-like peptidoglycan-associated protein